MFMLRTQFMMIHGVIVIPGIKLPGSGMVYLSISRVGEKILMGIGIPMIMSSSKTLATEVVKNDVKEIVFKLRQEYKPKNWAWESSQ